MKRYEIGTKNKVLLLMAEYAIANQEDFIEATAGCTNDSDVKAREHAKACVRDFKRVYNQVKHKVR